MRRTRGVSVWPVGLVGGLKWEGPICKNKKIVGFRVGFNPKRQFPMDMAGFAVNATLILGNPSLEFEANVAIGDSESAFLSKITSRNELEPLADQCTKVCSLKLVSQPVADLVWGHSGHPPPPPPKKRSLCPDHLQMRTHNTVGPPMASAPPLSTQK